MRARKLSAWKKSEERRKKNRETQTEWMHINRKLTNIATDAYVYCSRYMCLVHIWKHDWGFFSAIFSLPPKWICVFCVLFVVVHFFFQLHSVTLCLTQQRGKKTHKTPFTSHIECIKTAFLCIKIFWFTLRIRMAILAINNTHKNSSNEPCCSVLRYDVQLVLADRVKKPIQ